MWARKIRSRWSTCYPSVRTRNVRQVWLPVLPTSESGGIPRASRAARPASSVNSAFDWETLPHGVRWEKPWRMISHINLRLPLPDTPTHVYPPTHAHTKTMHTRKCIPQKNGQRKIMNSRNTTENIIWNSENSVIFPVCSWGIYRYKSRELFGKLANIITQTNGKCLPDKIKMSQCIPDFATFTLEFLNVLIN